MVAVLSHHPLAELDFEDILDVSEVLIWDLKNSVALLLARLRWGSGF
jgi:hypothetical protein